MEPGERKDRDVVRDIVNRIRRHRLSRYATGGGSLLRGLRWTLPILSLWGAYALLFGGHSLLRIWGMTRERARARTELAATEQERAKLESQLRDPGARRQQAERWLRERYGWAPPGEIIYRIPGPASDSTHRPTD